MGKPQVSVKDLALDERAFIAEYVKDMNPQLACERMGHDEISAQSAAYDYLSKEYMIEAMAEACLAHKSHNRLLKFSAEDLGITESYILMRLKSIADRAPKVVEQLKALDMLGKGIGMFKDKLEVSEARASAFTPEERQRMIETYRQRAMQRGDAE